MKKIRALHFSWLAVIAVIPIAAQVGCAHNKPVVIEDQNTAAAPAKINDPCRQGPITRKSAKENFSLTKALPKSLSNAQCISICKKEFTKRETRVFKFSPLVTIERLGVSNCNVEYYPHSPRDSSSRIVCDVDYTASYSPYSCPRPPLPRQTPNQ